MKVSYNELSGLCRRAFQGLGFPDGCHDDAAEMVVWLEQHGLGGIAALQAGLDLIQDGPPATLRRVFDDPGLAVVDAAGGSALHCGALAVDLAHAKARDSGLAVVRILNCHNRELLLGYLPRCARHGMNLLALWRDDPASGAVAQIASLYAGHDYPMLLRYQILDDKRLPAPDHGVTLITSPHFGLARSLHPNPNAAGLLELLEPEDFRERSRKAWSEGIEIDEAVWSRLKALADRLLVEESEESRRRGAGEQAG